MLSGKPETSDPVVTERTPTPPPTPPPTLFCIGCLQKEVPLINLLTCSHAEFITSFMVPEIKSNDQLICYPCHEMLKKIKLFKLQVEESFKLLYDSSTAKPPQCSIRKQNLTIHETLNLEIPQTSNTDNLETIDNTEEKRREKSLAPKRSQNKAKKSKNIKEALKIINSNQNDGFINVLASLQSISSSLVTDIYKTVTEQTDLNVSTASPTTNNATAISTDNVTEDEMVMNEIISENVDLPPDVGNEEIYPSVIEKDYSIDVSDSNMQIDATDALLGSKLIQLTLSKQELTQERAQAAFSPGYLRARYRCKSCLIGFQFEENLTDHVKRKHKLRNKQFHLKCRVCRQLVRRDLYDQHTFCHYNRFKCRSCGQEFGSYDNAALHYSIQHNTT